MKKVTLLIFAFISLIIFASISKPTLSKETAEELVYLPIIQKPANPYWRKTYPSQVSKDVTVTKDGGFLVLGPDNSQGFTLAKLDTNGNPLWEKEGSIYVVRPQVLTEADDGSIFIAGEAPTLTSTNEKFWVAKLSSTGDFIWQKGYFIANHGGNAFALTATANDGVAIAGYTNNDSDTDYWILNLDKNGTVIWQKTFGGNKTDLASVIKATPDNGFIISGYTYSFSTILSDTWVIKLNSQGNLVWQKTLRNDLSYDLIWDLAVTPDGSSYYIGKKSSASGSEVVDWWVFKLDSAGNLAWSKTFGLEGSGNSQGYSIFATDNNNIYISGASYKDEWLRLLFNLDTNGNPRWHRAYDHTVSIQHVDSQFITLSGSLNGDFMLAKSSLSGEIAGCAATTQPAITVKDIEKRIQTTSASLNSPAISISDTAFSVSGSTFPDALLACGG